VNTNVSLLVGVWAEPDATYQAEKDALLDALRDHGSGWLIGVAVGFEDAGLDSANMSLLVSQIDDVREAMGTVPNIVAGVNGVPVGHIDGGPGWWDWSNTSLIETSDFIGLAVDCYLQVWIT
jgi:exo-beta-1,3-glucanase (GH17 family)